MRRLIIAATCISLTTVVVSGQRGDSEQARRQMPGVITAPGAQVVNVPSSSATPTTRPCGTAEFRVAIVVRAVANLRDRANIAGTVVGEAKRGSALVVEKEDGSGSPWYEVTDVATGQRGWVHGNVIKIAYRK